MPRTKPSSERERTPRKPDTAHGGKPDQMQGLAGLFAHKLDDDGFAEQQMAIVRPLAGERWLVHFFSWLDGSPATLGAVDESDLLSPRYALYDSADSMKFAYEHGGMARPFKLP